jgi:hypothetical protein
MSRCKCGKRLTEAELKYKDPTTGEYLDYCFECIDASHDPELDPMIDHLIDIEGIEQEMNEDEFLTLVEEIENNA